MTEAEGQQQLEDQEQIRDEEILDLLTTFIGEAGYDLGVALKARKGIFELMQDRAEMMIRQNKFSSIKL